jgi:peroxiredoxin
MRRTVAAALVVAALGSPARAQSPTAAELAALALRTYPAGMAAPDFTVSGLDGRPVSLAALRGRVVLLNFWASWCLECRPEMPALERLHRQFGPSGLAVVGINARESRESVRRFAAELGVTFPLGLDPAGLVQSNYGVVGLPTTILIARNGHAVALAVGARDWGGAAGEAIMRALLPGPRPGGDR